MVHSLRRNVERDVGNVPKSGRRRGRTVREEPGVRLAHTGSVQETRLAQAGFVSTPASNWAKLYRLPRGKF